jgi:hypothetical protein
MDRYYFYIDFENGSGYVRITEYDLNLSLIKKRNINALIQRDYLEGALKLLGADSTLAKTAFLTSSKFKIPMRIYEWGVLGVGTLIWEGKAVIKSKFDNNRNFVELQSFETEDIYNDLLAEIAKDVIWESIPLTTGASTMEDPISEGVDSNCNKIQTINYSGGNFSTAGTPFSLPVLGRNAIGSYGSGLFIFDSLPGSLTRYVTSDAGLTYTLSTLGTKIYPSNAHRCRSGVVCEYNASSLIYLDDYNNNLRNYTWITGGWTLDHSLDINEQKNPELIFLYSGSPNYFALINEKNNSIARISFNGSSFFIGADSEIGEIKNPKAALITSDPSNPEIALIDSHTQTLRTYRYDITSGWTKLGNSISLGNVQAPCIARLDTNLYAVYDNYIGIIQAYSWSGSAWSKTGNPFTYDGGYYADMVQVSTNRVILASSDSIKLGSAINWDTSSILNGILDYLDLHENGYGMSRTTHGANFDPTNVMWGLLNTVTDLGLDREIALTRVNVQQILDYIEQMFQNYWYVEDDPEGVFDYQIKFAQPNEFSSFGTDVDVSDQTEDLDIREYLEDILTDIENIEFTNAFNSDFIGYDIEYARGTGRKIDSNITITTDWGAVIDKFLNRNERVQLTGLFALYGETDSDVNNHWVVDNGTSPNSVQNVRNEQLCKARLQNDYLNDYRYANVGNININGSSVSVQDTCRPIIDFPIVEVVFDNYPAQLASLDWGSGIKSFITEAETILKSGKTIIRSTLLDI